MASVTLSDGKRRKPTGKAETSPHDKALRDLAAAEAAIVQQQRFQGLQDLPELELMEAATELTLRQVD